MARSFQYNKGFTLIELSIVLVIIGLIVGGVLTGRDLIKASEVRATITQMEKYSAAVNTFRGKYNALPGDLDAQTAAQFGFAARGTLPGQGDGNGVIEGYNPYASPANAGFYEEEGETGLFWVDLSQARLIDGSFSTITCCADPVQVPITPSGSGLGSMNLFFPQAKLGGGNYIYVTSGGYGAGQNGFSYFTMSALTTLQYFVPNSTPGLTVQQAYSIDKKIDDGYAQSGHVMAMYLNSILNNGMAWAAGGGNQGASQGGYLDFNPTTAATPGSSTTCYDNGNVAGALQQYSIEISNGANVNCALSFQFQ